MILPSLQWLLNHKVQLEFLTKHVMLLDVLDFLKNITSINNFSKIFRILKIIIKYTKKQKTHTMLENTQSDYLVFLYIIHPFFQDQVQPNGLLSNI